MQNRNLKGTVPQQAARLPGTVFGGGITNATAHTNGHSIGSLDNLPKQFVSAMRILFDIMDDQRQGVVQLADIEHRWKDDDAKGMPRGVIESLRKVTPPNGLLTFERFCTGLKICLLRNQPKDNSHPMIHTTAASVAATTTTAVAAATSVDLHTDDGGLVKHMGWNTAAVRPNNATINGHRTLSLPQLSPASDFDAVVDKPAVVQPIITGPLYGPPKPPRVGLNVDHRVTLQPQALPPPVASNGGGTERMDKAEIRNALQNWQMGILMNDMDGKEKAAAVVVARLNRGPADGQTDAQQQPPPVFQKKANIRRREPRRHTLQNGIDYNMLKRLKQFEQEKDVLQQGFAAVNKAKEWYIKQIAIVQDKIKYMGRMGAHSEQWSEAQQERLDLQRARVLEVNRHLAALADSWERGGFPIHMNLALRNPAMQYAYSSDIVNRLKQQNRQLTEEVSQKSEKITALEGEKATLIRDMVQCQRAQRANINPGTDEAIF